MRLVCWFDTCLCRLGLFIGIDEKSLTRQPRWAGRFQLLRSMLRDPYYFPESRLRQETSRSYGCPGAAPLNYTSTVIGPHARWRSATWRHS
jgi:hypothetical protein